MVEVKFLILASGYNVEKYVEDCLTSIEAQTYRNFELIVIDDASSDNSRDVIQKYLRATKDLKWCAEYEFRNKGIVKCRHDALKRINHTINFDVIVWLDLDDRLLPNALETLNLAYQSSDCWLTYGNYIIKDTGQVCFDENTIKYEDKPARHQDWKFIHLRSFRKELYYHLTDADLFPKQKTIYPDINMLYCLMELAGKDHIVPILDVIYEYNNMNPLAITRRFTQEQRDSELAFVKGLEPKKPLECL
jgi:glycosyltransferase involved in cell wall biosynthesis